LFFIDQHSAIVALIADSSFRPRYTDCWRKCAI